MTAETEGDSALDMAARRLERAVSLLEKHLADRKAEAGAESAFDQDRARLAAELDAAKAREKALEQAGGEASVALGRAIEQIRAALGDS
jgi:multidrug resistance efflux pump